MLARCLPCNISGLSTKEQYKYDSDENTCMGEYAFCNWNIMGKFNILDEILIEWFHFFRF